MHRVLYLLGWSYVAFCSALVVRPLFGTPTIVPRASVPAQQPRVAAPPEHMVPPSGATTGAEWFRRMKPYCNSVEVTTVVAATPAPATMEGAGYHAACLALAGKIDAARRVIDARPAHERANAAHIVFAVGHPVADAGDDRSAGPIMELVVDYVPTHYMALYHAGMAEYMLGQRALARRNLGAFLEYYHESDGWRANGIEVLRRLNDSSRVDGDPRRPREPAGE